MSRFICLDCHADTSNLNEYYMVTDSVWKRTGLGSRGGMLCIGCLEKRIGRELNVYDFRICPLNAIAGSFVFKKSERLVDRLTRV